MTLRWSHPELVLGNSQGGDRIDTGPGAPLSSANTVVQTTTRRPSRSASGSEHVRLGLGAAARETRQGERRDVHAPRAAVEDQLGHQKADRGRMHEAVAGEAAGDVEARGARGLAEDAVVIRR